MVKRILSGLFFMGVFILLSIDSSAQTDKVFWFSIPEINRYHQSGTVSNPCNDGTPTTFRITTLEKPAVVTISMPANEANFSDIVISIPANFTEKVELYNYISTDVVTPAESMENLLAWTSSNTTAAKPYINRNNKGIKITSTELITVYYEIGAINNKELLTLKGKNALGEKFFVPFQDEYPIYSSYNYTRRPYGSFDIVATHDDTHVQITVPAQIFTFSNGAGVNYLSAGTHNLYLDAGQTAIITPYQSRTNEYKTSFTTKLKGSMVEVIQNEAGVTKTIAVITKEDMVFSPGSIDYVADQLIPITHIGTSYAVVRGYAQNNPSSTSYEHFYVVGTEAGTSVTVEFSDASPSLSFTLGAGTQQKVQIPFAAEVATVESTNPVYVFHQSGVGNQFAGAIIPTISVCTGNFVSAFNRTMGVNEYSECPLRPAENSTNSFNFYLNILVYEGAEDGFRLLKEGVDVTATELPALLAANASTTFKPLPGATPPYTKYKYARIEANSLTKNTAYRLVNDKNVFHLGVINGAGSGVTTGNADAFYGYFSDFNEIIPKVYEDYGNDDSYVGCYGDNVELIAEGGRTFSWHPTKFLDNPASATPTAINVTENITYEAKISGACALEETVEFDITVSDPVWASFTSDVTSGCAPLKVEFTNLSTGHKEALSSWDLNNDGDYGDAFFYKGTDPTAPTAPINPLDPPNPGDVLGKESEIIEIGGKFTAWFDNNTDLPIDYEVKLLVYDEFELCPKELIKTITVYPRITANFTSPSTTSSPNCNPHTAEFTPVVTGEIGQYYWQFGDNNTSYLSNPSNTYFNNSNAQHPFKPRLTVTDKWNECSDWQEHDIMVQPFIKASFTASNTKGCSPLVNDATTIKNTSAGPPSLTYLWLLKDQGGTTIGSSNTNTPPAEVYSLTNTRTDNLVQKYTLSLTVSYGGCTSAATPIEFTVFPNPTAIVSITPPGTPDINCSPLDIDLSATTIRNTNSYQWLVNGVSRLSNSEPIGTPPPNFTGSLTLDNYGNAPVVKVVSYKATNTWGCELVSTPLSVNVQPFIRSEIVLNPEVICPNSNTGLFDVNISDAKIVADGNYEWFVDGATQGVNTSIGIRTFNYNTLIKDANGEAVIDLQLVVENAAGCTRIDNQQIKVNPRVSVNFDAFIGATLIAPGAGGTGTTLCPPETVNFTSSVTYANSYHWQFGSLKEATTSNSFLDITNAGSAAFDLPVTLTASNSYGCSGSITKTYTIEPEVVANFNIKSQAGCAPFTLEVNAIGIGTTYDWTFNGQVINNNANPSFNPVGNQTGGPLVRPIILKAVRGKCSLENKDISVTIYPEVRARWNFTAPADYCAPVDNATFTNNSDLYVTANKVNNIQWEVFDGATMVTSTSAASFKPILPNTSHTAQKNYNVRLTATSAHGCVGQTQHPITVNPVPLAKFNAVITEECTPMKINITNESETVANGDYNWNWDGGTSLNTTGQNYTVTYSNASVSEAPKDIVLTLTNTHGCSDSYDYLFTVMPQVNANLSIARLTPNDNCGDETFTFTNNSTAGSTIKYYEWTFGTDKMVTSSTADFNRSFTAHGTNPLDIPVSVKAFNSIGCSNVVPAQETIIVFPKVVAAQSFAIGDICDGDVDLTLTNASSNVGSTHANATPNFLWTFTPSTGDGTPKTSTGGSVDLINSGLINPVVYDVDFIAETVWNYKSITRTCKNEITGNPVTVYPNLSPIYDIPPAVCSGLTGAELVFVKNAASSGGNVGDVSIQWDFSDGNTRTTGFNPNVTKLFTNLSDEDFITTTKIFATQTATGCTANREIDVRVHPKVESIFTFELGDVCTYPLPVTFTNASKYSKAQTGVNTTFHWNYGYNWSGVNQEDTRTSGAGHTYSFYNSKPDETVDYDITLTIKQEHQASNLSCNHQFSRKITVHPEQVANFNLPVVEGCNPLTVEFKNLSTGVLPAKGGKFAWTFGDGTGSSILDPSNKVYSHTNREQSIDYPIELTTTNPLGCKKTTTSSIEVYPLVVSSFDIGQLAGCTPLNVEVNNTSVSSAYKYDWSFTNGNPGTSNAPQPGTIQFINPLGASDVLAVQHPVLHLKTLLDITKYPVGGGCAEEDSKTVDVYPHVYPSFNATLEGCHPLENVEFENTSNVIGGTDKGTYTWVFGNGIQSNTISPKQTYKNADFEQNKTFDGTLRAESSHGCTDLIPFLVTVWPTPQARLEMSNYMNCSPFDLGIANLSVGKGKGSTLEYTYNFGDGTAELVTFDPANINHIYHNLNADIEPYTLSLALKTSDGCTDKTTQTIHVYPEVTPIFDTHDGIYEQCNPFEVQFTNSSKNAYSYFWEFDNGSTSQSDAPRYRFVNDGITDRIYNVKLTAMSEFDCEDEAILPITVFAAPIVDFIIIPSHQVFPQNGTLPTFNFKNQSRPKGIPASWPHAWTFGDGNTSTSMDEMVAHTYETWGKRDDDFRYEVTLEIKNDKCSDLVSQKLTLLPPEPKSIFDANKFRACSPLEVKFYNGSQFYFTENGITAFEWRIDNEDPPFSTEFEPSYTFTEPGYYNVGLTVYGDGGEKHFFRTFRVYENPVAMFEAMPERVTLPNAKVHFYNLSQQADSSIWVFGDNSLESTEWDPVHIYREMGEYQVSLTAISINDDDSECIDIYSKFPAVWVLGSGKIRFPNAFVPSKLGPNGGAYDAIDYKNEVFHPVAEGVIEYRLLIFNRWGEQIFESKDINIGWDGYFKGKLASQDVYVWRAIGRFANGDMFDERGNVTLLR